MVKFGYNWDTESVNFDKAIPAMRVANADAHLMMVNPHSFWLGEGDIANIRRVLEALPDCLIIVRVFHGLQGDWKLYPPASEYEKRWRWYKEKFGSELIKRLVFDDPCNEPMLSNDSVVEIRAYVKRCVALVEAAGRAGIKFAVGAWSVGTPNERWFETEFMVLWRAIPVNNCAISAHAYSTIPSIAGETAGIELALDPVASRASLNEDKRIPLEHDGFTIARMFRLIKIWVKYELATPAQPYPEIFITEGIIDNVYNSGNSHIKEQWRGLHGDNAYNRDPRGAEAFHLFLDKMFKGENKSFSQQLGVIHRWARRNIFYHPAFKAVCLFALNFQWGYRYAGYATDGQHKQAGSNYDRPIFDDFRMIELPTINAESLEDTMPQFPLYPASFHSLKISNVRHENDVSSEIDYALETTPLQGYIAKEGTKMLGSSFDGLAIQFLHPATLAVVTGFIAKTTNLVIDYAETVKHYRLEFDGATQIVSEETWLALIKHHELRAASLKTIQPE